MKIRKIGHCCLLIKTGDITILTDPGMFSVGQSGLKGIDVVLITHEHADHVHVESLKEIVLNNPNVRIITNSGVAKILAKESIACEVVEARNTESVGGCLIEAFDSKHEEIFEDFGQVQNTGYLIDGKLFYPGDSFCNPEKSIDILALPVAGPWCKISDAIRYALLVKPKKAFPVHDGMLQKERIGGAHKVPETILTTNGIEFVAMNDGDEREF